MKFENLFALVLALIPLTVYGFVGVGFMGGSSPSSTVNWDLLNEDCSDISDWSDLDSGNGVSEVSPAGQFRMDCNLHTTSNYAWRYRDIGSFPNTFTIEIKVYHDDIYTNNSNNFEISCKQSDEQILIKFSTTGLLIYDTDSGNTEVGTDLVKEGGSAEWQTWRFLVTFTETTGDGTCDVYLTDSTHNKEKVGTSINCSDESSGTDGVTNLLQVGIDIDNMLTHIDYIKIATGLHTP